MENVAIKMVFKKGEAEMTYNTKKKNRKRNNNKDMDYNNSSVTAV